MIHLNFGGLWGLGSSENRGAPENTGRNAVIPKGARIMYRSVFWSSLGASVAEKNGPSKVAL